MSKIACKNITKNLSSKYSEKLLDHGKKKPATDGLKTAARRTIIQKTAEVTRDLIRKKIADKITRVPKNSPKNNSETNK